MSWNPLHRQDQARPNTPRAKPKTPKKWLYPLGIAIEYERYINTAAVKPTIEAVERYVIPALPSDRRDAPDDPNWYTSLNAAFQRALEAARLDPAKLAPFVRFFAQRVNIFNRNQWHSILKQAYGVDVFASEPNLTPVLRAFEIENIRLIKSIPEQYLGSLQGKIVTAVQQGTNLRDLTKMIRDTYGLPRNRAELIARDQVGKLNGQLSQERQTAAGVTEYRWRGVLDQREREHHVDREGQEFKWTDPPSDGNPGQPIRCFPGSVGVAFADGYDKLWRHHFRGALATVETAGGVLLEATPNHPVMTGRGWMALGEVKQGDDLLQAVRQAGLIGKADVGDFESGFKKVFDLACLTASSLRQAGSEFDFHGEIPKEDVDAVLIAGGLGFGHFAQSVEQLRLTGTDIDMAYALLNPFGGSNAAFSGDVLGVLPECFVGFSRDRFAALFIQLRHAYQVGLRAGSDRQVSGANDSIYDNAVDLMLLRQLQDARAFKVGGDDLFFVDVGSTIVCGATALADGRIDAASAEVLAEIVRMAPKKRAYLFEGHAVAYELVGVVKVGSREFDGHVYNAGTPRGWYLANGIVSHNCRCWAEAVLPAFDDLNALFVH